MPKENIKKRIQSGPAVKGLDKHDLLVKEIFHLFLRQTPGAKHMEEIRHSLPPVTIKEFICIYTISTGKST